VGAKNVILREFAILWHFRPHSSQHSPTFARYTSFTSAFSYFYLLTYASNTSRFRCQTQYRHVVMPATGGHARQSSSWVGAATRRHLASRLRRRMYQNERHLGLRTRPSGGSVRTQSGARTHPGLILGLKPPIFASATPPK